jgi:hypothetical protein
MYVSPEWLLAAGLVAIYLFDSVQFLQIGEAVVSTRRASLRTLSFGSSFELGGRRPYLPNPLTPWWPELLIDWTASSRGPMPEQLTTEMRQHLRMVQPIAWFAAACAGLVAVVAPLALVGGDQEVFVACILMCLVCAVPGCVLVIRRRRFLGLTLWQAVSISAVALICLPCSGNLGRASAIKRRWTAQASELPDLGFEVAEKALNEGKVREMLTRAQRLCAEDTVEYQLVTAQLRRLEARPNEPH